MKRWWLLLCACIYSLSFAAAVDIQSARLTANETTTRLILTMSDKARFTYEMKAAPTRLVLTFKDTTLDTSVAALKNPVVKKITALQQGENVQLTFFLTQVVRANTFFIEATPKRSLRFILDMTGVPLLRDVKVVIDPGHGGKDPGALGHRGAREKDVVLAISRYLADDLNHQKGMSAVLTRTRDSFLTLRQRLAFAHAHQADIFISVHADAFDERSARGASVYALSEGGATSEAAHFLAARENHAEWVGGINFKNKDYLLKSVLLDLTQSATLARSVELGDAVIDQLDDITHLHIDHVEQAPFIVLRSPDIPSILVETGYISNVNQEALLSNATFQKNMAKAIFQGVVRYVNQHPPKGSIIEFEKHRTMTYRVKSGDTLQALARAHDTTVELIQKLNKLDSDDIYAGQTLTLPSAQK